MKKQKHFFLFRGLAREAAHWGDFISILKNHFPQDKITSIDLPGSGEFLNIDCPISIDNIARFMREKYLLLSSKEEENILIAVSLGGMIATEWMKLFPNDFSNVVLINSSFGGLSPFYHRLKPGSLAKLLATPFLGPEEREKIILKIVANDSQKINSTLALWCDIAKARPISLKNIVRQIIAAGTFRIKNFTPKNSILILVSKRDKLVHPNCSRKIAQLWKVPIVEHQYAGHDLSLDDPEWVCLETKKWLQVN